MAGVHAVHVCDVHDGRDESEHHHPEDVKSVEPRAKAAGPMWY